MRKLITIAMAALMAFTLECRAQSGCVPQPLPWFEDFESGFASVNSFGSNSLDTTFHYDNNCWTYCAYHTNGVSEIRYPEVITLTPPTYNWGLWLQKSHFVWWSDEPGEVFAVTPPFAEAPRRVSFLACYPYAALNVVDTVFPNGMALAIGYITDEDDPLGSYVAVDTVTIHSKDLKNRDFICSDLGGRSIPPPYRLVFRIAEPLTTPRYLTDVVVDDVTVSNQPLESTFIHYSLAEGDTVWYDSTAITAAGTYLFHYTATDGCDSTVRVIVTDCAPQPCVELNRPFIDLDYPVVYFTDCSEGSVSSTWHFSDGTTLNGRQVRRQFHHPLPDSVEVRLTTCSADNCCADTTFTLRPQARSVWFPNVVVPDGERDNLFGCITTYEVEEFCLEVYNRWGQLLWTTDDMTEQWDGKFQGTSLPQGSYVYLWYLKDREGDRRQGIGTITLLR